MSAPKVTDQSIERMISKLLLAGVLLSGAIVLTGGIYYVIRHASEPQMRAIGDYELRRMERVQAYLGLRGSRNINELVDVPSDRMKSMSSDT